ncbi:hypothetical protein K402DRAFT_389667 [Aulographum hederae CBS 113979]|uniref:Uncharacterized protein n=1 Tax=Aulographum hederae CBS 113979 TaxID=1176131 RepID=A0A6G1HCK6_9PEZI|nr:hypothetical protein K402DRAFT_389667 [Aulographum hederae CBS 113979]
MSPTQDPHTGGSLTDMAEHGTSIPNDAGKMNIIPSVPRPDQMSENTSSFDTHDGLGAPNLASAADNDTNMPRGPRDMGASDDVVTGTGNQMPASAETKRMNEFNTDTPAAKGHNRDGKAGKMMDSELDENTRMDGRQ